MPYLCYLCGYQHKYKSSVMAHMKTHTMGKVDQWGSFDPSHIMSDFEDDPYSWEPFGKQMARHGKKGFEKTLRRVKERGGESGDHRSNRGTLQKPHKMTHSSEIGRRVRSIKCSGTVSLPVRKTHTTNKCGICDHRDSSSGYLKRQMTSLMRRLLRRHAAEKSCSCELCDYSSDEPTGLHVGTRDRRSNTARKHERTHSDDPYDCGLCDYKRNRPRGFEDQRPVRTNGRGKVDDCDLCYDQSSSSSCDSCDYAPVRVKDSRRRMVNSEDELYGSCDYRSTRNGQVMKHSKSPKRDKHYGRGMYARERKAHAEDSLPYAVVLVTGDPHTGQKRFVCA